MARLAGVSAKITRRASSRYTQSIQECRFCAALPTTPAAATRKPPGARRPCCREATRAGGSGGDGEVGGAAVLEGGDVVDVAEGQADVIEALHQPPAGVVVDLEGR